MARCDYTFQGPEQAVKKALDSVNIHAYMHYQAINSYYICSNFRTISVLHIRMYSYMYSHAQW